MGMQVRLVVYATDEAHARRAATAGFAEIARLDGIFSNYRRASEINDLVRAGVGVDTPISPELATVLRHALRLAADTGGAFDPTVGPLTALWRNVLASGQLPTDELIAETKLLVGWEKVSVDADRDTARLTTVGMQLDLGAIAKGFILDRALATLGEHGIASGMVEAGGDLVVSGAPPERAGWRIALPYPGSCTIDLIDEALSTSGDTEQFVEIQGVRYSHTVDVRTGYGLTNRALVTVVADAGINADGIATSLTLLDPSDGRRLFESSGAPLAVVASARPGDEQSQVWGERRMRCVAFHFDGETGGR